MRNFKYQDLVKSSAIFYVLTLVSSTSLLALESEEKGRSQTIRRPSSFINVKERETISEHPLKGGKIKIPTINDTNVGSELEGSNLVGPNSIIFISSEDEIQKDLKIPPMERSMADIEETVQTDDIETMFNRTAIVIQNTNQLLDQEVEAIDKQVTADRYKKVSKKTAVASQYVNLIGTGVSMVSTFIPEPNAKLGTRIAGIVINILASALKKVVSPMLKHRADVLRDESLRLSSPLSTSEAIYHELHRLEKKENKLYSKLVKAKKLTRLRQFTDRLYITSDKERIKNSEKKYRPLIHKFEKKKKDLIDLKENTTSLVKYLVSERKNKFLNEKEGGILEQERIRIPNKIDQLLNGIGYLLHKIVISNNPEKYQSLIHLKEIELIRIKNLQSIL